jgi:hypothetical protein
MTRRVLAFVLALTIAGGAQGTLMYAAATPSVADLLGNPMTDGAIQCQRGANPCFGYGSWNCCTEAYVLGLIGASLGNWIAVSVNVFHYWYYC